MSLLELITGSVGNQIAEKTESKFGVSKTQMLALLAVATPLIISALRKNSEKGPEHEEEINKALNANHDGSILENIDSAASRTEEGSSILNHIFGDNKQGLENQLSQKTGIGLDKLGPILSMLAPIVMGYIGKQKQENPSNTGISDLLGGIINQGAQNANSGNPIMDLATQFLDKDKDGSMIDDIFGMFSKK